MVLVQKCRFFELSFQAIHARKMSFMILQNEKTTFQAIKSSSSKSRKIDIFPMGLTHGFVSKMFFFKLFIYAKQARKMSFMIFWIEKTTFQAKILRSSKSRKIDIFPKALIHCFGPKMVIFPPFFFLAIQARKMSRMTFQNEKMPFQAIKTTSSKSRKIDIFPKGLIHKFAPQMAIFPSFFFQAIYARKMSFMILQNE